MWCWQTFCGWILTIVLTALFCAGLTSLAVYAPNKPNVYDNNYVATRLDGLVGNIVREVNGTNRALPTPNAALTRSIAVCSNHSQLLLCSHDVCSIPVS